MSLDSAEVPCPDTRWARTPGGPLFLTKMGQSLETSKSFNNAIKEESKIDLILIRLLKT